MIRSMLCDFHSQAFRLIRSWRLRVLVLTFQVGTCEPGTCGLRQKRLTSLRLFLTGEGQDASDGDGGEAELSIDAVT
jgi:hypothetical protein